MCYTLYCLEEKDSCFGGIASYSKYNCPNSQASLIINFKKILAGRGVTVTQRYRFGQDIEAACGQLASKK